MTKALAYDKEAAMDRVLDLLLHYYGYNIYLLIFGVLMACGLGLPVPEDIILFAGGIASYYGLTNLGTTILVSYVGVLLGDSIMFFLGAKYGRGLTKSWVFKKLLTEDRLRAVRKKFHDRGNKLLFAARFMPGLRAPVFFSAGVLHLPYRVFLFYDGIAALVSVPAIIWAVFYFGDELDFVVRVIRRIEHGILFVILGVIVTIAFKWYVTHRKMEKK